MQDCVNNELRKEYIGGSDIASVMGLSRWSTPLETWCHKTGATVKEDISKIEYVEIGTELEDYVAKRFERKSGHRVRRDERDFVHPKYPYMRAHIDRWIIGGQVLECKTVSAWKLKEWEKDEIPQEYFLQLHWYLGIVGHKTGWIAALVGGQAFIYKQIEFNQELFDKQVEAAQNFWENHVLADVAPMAIVGDHDVLNELYPESTDNIRILSGDQETEFNSLVDERLGGKEQLRLVEDEIERVENRIKQILGESVMAETGQYKVTWKSQNNTKVDTEALKNDGVYEKYAVTKQIRVLRTTAKKDKS